MHFSSPYLYLDLEAVACRDKDMQTLVPVRLGRCDVVFHLPPWPQRCNCPRDAIASLLPGSARRAHDEPHPEEICHQLSPQDRLLKDGHGRLDARGQVDERRHVRTQLGGERPRELRLGAAKHKAGGVHSARVPLAHQVVAQREDRPAHHARERVERREERRLLRVVLEEVAPPEQGAHHLHARRRFRPQVGECPRAEKTSLLEQAGEAERRGELRGGEAHGQRRPHLQARAAAVRGDQLRLEESLRRGDDEPGSSREAAEEEEEQA
mmetsp:Transcript_20661/g.43893  ORF Transcript_20661/g.43893 Transcript_20661/m.43893 type:complete len:267 (+) Transcript_20661:415-1215(+)